MSGVVTDSGTFAAYFGAGGWLARAAVALALSPGVACVHAAAANEIAKATAARVERRRLGVTVDVPLIRLDPNDTRSPRTAGLGRAPFVLALEHLVMLELDRDHGTSAGELVTTLATDPGKHAERDRHLKDLTLMDVTTCSARCRSRVTAAMGARLPRSRS